ncbi:MAG: hypothetical protein PHY72_01830 [Candidatus Pacebacteria bacterium]|nr:hypothetical protein [Candidatus Paceibacterota bacterium]
MKGFIKVKEFRRGDYFLFGTPGFSFGMVLNENETLLFFYKGSLLWEMKKGSIPDDAMLFLRYKAPMQVPSEVQFASQAALVATANCPKCLDLGFVEMLGGGVLPCGCSAGDLLMFNVGDYSMSGAEVRRLSSADTKNCSLVERVELL